MLVLSVRFRVWGRVWSMDQGSRGQGKMFRVKGLRLRGSS
jgi:hypothetical protein